MKKCAEEGEFVERSGKECQISEGVEKDDAPVRGTVKVRMCIDFLHRLSFSVYLLFQTESIVAAVYAGGLICMLLLSGFCSVLLEF